MKKYLIGSIFGFTLALTSMSVFANVQQYILTKSNSIINVEGVAYESDENPILLYDGTTYVPLRAFTNMIGLDISYNEKTKAIDISSPKDITTNNSDNSSNTSNSSVDDNSNNNPDYIYTDENGIQYVVDWYLTQNVLKDKNLNIGSYDKSKQTVKIFNTITDEVIIEDVPFITLETGRGYINYDFYENHILPKIGN